MAEASGTASTVVIAPGQLVRTPTLAGMLLLKLLAWGFRRDERDARDLGVLLDATAEPPFDDDLWRDPGSAHHDYDPFLAGPAAQGRLIAAELRPATVGVCSS